jgi:hypothetical protein
MEKIIKGIGRSSKKQQFFSFFCKSGAKIIHDRQKHGRSGNIFNGKIAIICLQKRHNPVQ